MILAYNKVEMNVAGNTCIRYTGDRGSGLKGNERVHELRAVHLENRRNADRRDGRFVIILIVV